MAEESERLANTAMEMALRSVKAAEAQVAQWNEMVKSNLCNPEALGIAISERDKANERLGKAMAFFLQLTNSKSHVQDSSVPKIIFTKWESKHPVTNQPFKVDQEEFTLSEKLANTILATKLSDFFQDEYGKFPSKYFVRQEENKLWEIMLTRLDRAIPSVIVGSPGVGKSVFLMMLGFYVALVKKQSVLILRSLESQEMVYLYFDMEHFARGRLSNLSEYKVIKESFTNARVFLDGFQDEEVNGPTKILSKFHVLATSSQYDSKSNDPAELVVLPAWRLKDLQSYAEVTNWARDINLRKRVHPKMIPILVKLQYFYSGGSMREFCREHQQCQLRCQKVAGRISEDQKYLLLSGFGQQGSQVDRIRRHFIADTSNLDHYQNSKYWQTSVDSGWVMRWLLVNRKIEKVYTFYQYAKAVRGGFYDSAFECLFHHTILQYHKTHRIVLLASDKCSYSHVELEVDNVVCSGNGLKECHEILKALSAELYWYPDDAYLPFIDCVCQCRLVHKSGFIEEKFGCIQVTIATKKVFRPHLMVELEKMKESNPSLRGHKAIYLVVTPSKGTCDSFQLVQNAMHENELDEYDLSDVADECPGDDDESMKRDQGEQPMQEEVEENSDWEQVITYLDPDSVYGLKDGAHLVMKNTEDLSQKKRREIS